MSIDGVADVREPGWVSRVDIGHQVAALTYADGSVGIEHPCRTIHYEGGGDQVHVLAAPKLALGHGHVVQSTDPLTVAPSIACPDCGLHGFIRQGRWEPC